jgi:hypothetical protein
MKLKTLTILCFLFCLNLTENTVSAGGPSDPKSDPPPNKDQLCLSECLRNGQKLTSRNGKILLLITERGAINVINIETGLLMKSIFGSNFPCPVEICIDPNGKLKVTACGVIIYEVQIPPGSCLQITDDGRVIIADKDGKEVMEVFKVPIGILV